jgi:hypothetical protein
MRFGVLREVYQIQHFHLELRASVWGYLGEYPVQMLEEAVTEEKAKWGSDHFFSDPPVVYDPQRTRPWY